MTTTTKPRYLSTAETAKLIRKTLKREFPDTKFSVRSKNYSGGSSVTIRWTDGPTRKAVDRVTSIYQSKGFDGMIDCSYYHGHCWLATDGSATRAVKGEPKSGELVSMGAGYVFAERDYSAELLTATAEHVSKHFGIEPPKVTIEPWGAEINRDGPRVVGTFTAGDLVYRELWSEA